MNATIIHCEPQTYELDMDKYPALLAVDNLTDFRIEEIATGWWTAALTFSDGRDLRVERWEDEDGLQTDYYLGQPGEVKTFTNAAGATYPIAAYSTESVEPETVIVTAMSGAWTAAMLGNACQAIYDGEY